MEKTINNASDFYRQIRPEYFSDSFIEQEIQLPREHLAYELNQLSVNMKQDLFENLARKMCEKLITPNLIPQTWPTWWWDWKTDSETYPVSKLISDRWYINGDWSKKDENWAFAFSVKTDWKTKVKWDVKKIVETNRGYSKIYFVSNQLISSKKKKNAQDEFKSEYWIDIIILDWEWILEKVYSNDYINTVVESLNLSQSYKTKTILWENDISRKKQLEELENNIKKTDRYFDYDIQLISDALDSALLSRMLELSKDDVIWKFMRARRFNETLKSRKFDIKITYQLCWTYFMYFNEYEAFLDEFLSFKSYFDREENYDIWDIELYSNLMSLLTWLSAHYDLKTKNLNIDDEANIFLKKLQKFKCKNSTYTSSCLLWKFFEVNTLIMQSIKSWKQFDDNLDEIIFILDKSKNLLDFPFELIKKFTREIWRHFSNLEKLDELFDKIAEIEIKRSWEKQAGRVFLERWMQKIDWENFKESLIYFWKSVAKLAKDESKEDMYYSLLWLSISYLELWLNYSYYNSMVCALNNKLQIFFDWWKINNSVLVLLKEIIKNEILIWRIPYIFIYTELYQILSTQTLDENKVSREQFLSQIDAFLAVRLLNTDILKVRKYNFLPDLLEDFGFFISKSVVFYLIWQNNLIDKEVSEIMIKDENIDKFFKKMQNQPLLEQFVWKTEFQDLDDLNIRTRVLWVEIKVNNVDNILFAEELLAFIEWYFSTGMKEVYSKVWVVELNLIYSENENSINIDTKLNHHIYSININKSFSNIWDFFHDIVVQIFVNTFISNEPLKYFESLYYNEQVYERVSIILNHTVIIKNILWNSAKLSINDWDKSNYKKYKVLKAPNIWKIKNIAKSWSEILSRHDKLWINTIINMDYWEKAEWNSFWVVTQPGTLAFWIIVWFGNEDYAQKIADEWIDMFWYEDINNTIRIHILKWIDKDNPLHYRVWISSNIDIEKNESELVLGFIRNKTITPNSSTNLDLLEKIYKQRKEYYLHIAYSDIKNNKQELIRGFYIKKTEIIIKNVWDLKKWDIEMWSIYKWDNPLIPDWIDNQDLINKIRWVN